MNELQTFKTMNEKTVQSLNRQIDEYMLKCEAHAKTIRHLEEQLREARLSYEGETRVST